MSENNNNNNFKNKVAILTFNSRTYIGPFALLGLIITSFVILQEFNEKLKNNLNYNRKFKFPPARELGSFGDINNYNFGSDVELGTDLDNAINILDDLQKKLNILFMIFIIFSLGFFGPLIVFMITLIKSDMPFTSDNISKNYYVKLLSKGFLIIMILMLFVASILNMVYIHKSIKGIDNVKDELKKIYSPSN